MKIATINQKRENYEQYELLETPRQDSHFDDRALCRNLFLS